MAACTFWTLYFMSVCVCVWKSWILNKPREAICSCGKPRRSLNSSYTFLFVKIWKVTILLVPLIKATFPREWLLEKYAAPLYIGKDIQKNQHRGQMARARTSERRRRSPFHFLALIHFSLFLSFPLFFPLSSTTIDIHTWNVVASAQGYINNPITSLYCWEAVRCKDIVFRGLVYPQCSFF